MSPTERQWAFFALLAALLALLVMAWMILYHPTPENRNLKGCLEWCFAHGAYETPEEYLDCTERCQTKLLEVAHDQ